MREEVRLWTCLCVEAIVLSREVIAGKRARPSLAKRGRLPGSVCRSRQDRGQGVVKWHSEADVVVVGAGATGLPAAIVAREAGSSVIVVEAQPHAGGHAMISGGNVPLGGGTSAQRKHGIDDSPDLLFQDLTDWSIVQPNGFPDYRYNDREIVRAFADPVPDAVPRQPTSEVLHVLDHPARSARPDRRARRHTDRRYLTHQRRADRRTRRRPRAPPPPLAAVPPPRLTSHQILPKEPT